MIYYSKGLPLKSTKFCNFEQLCSGVKYHTNEKYKILYRLLNRFISN
jgi:hypothetical protein